MYVMYAVVRCRNVVSPTSTASMTGFLKSVFGQTLGMTGKAPSFNDFSLHVVDDGAPS